MIERYINTQELDKICHDWAKQHNPELEEGAAEAYKQGILLGVYSMQSHLSITEYYFHIFKTKVKRLFKK